MAILNSGLAKSAAADAYTIDNSLRFDDGDSAYLSRTQTAGNRKTWTWSGWLKRAALSATLDIFGTVSSGDGLRWYGSPNTLNFLCDGSSGAWLLTNRVFRDDSAWYHIVVAFDTTETTAADRVKLYINGEQYTWDGATTFPDEDDEFKINQSGEVFSIGRGHGNDYLDGYIAEVYFTDGTAYDADDFGELDSTTNQWKPIDASGLTFGTNGFYQKYGSTEANTVFDDSSSSDHTITAVGDTKNVRGIANFQCDVLAVAGGGGGGMQKTGSGYGGGGGAGGLIYKTNHAFVTNTPLAVTIGAGGRGGYASSNVGATGDDTTVGTFTAKGGGGGGGESVGTTGGSGGGSSFTTGTAAAATQPSQSGDSGTYGHGYAGGTGYGAARDYRTAGGGGAGAIGESSPTSGGSGDGGDGYATTIRTGVSTTYAGGGGGGATSNGPNLKGVGGAGGGGDGSPTVGTSGADATGFGSGGGGGFGADYTAAIGGAGSDGIVVIRYASATALATGGTITTYDDSGTTYQVHSFTSSGTFTPTTKNLTQGSSSIEFDGTGDYLTVPDSSDWTFGADDFTVEMWVKFDAINTYNALIGHFYNAGGANLKSWFIRYNSDGTILFRYTTDGATEIDLLSSDAGLTTNRWYHLAITRQSTNIRYYVDGVQLDTDGIATASIADASVLLYISAYVGASALHFLDGNMDELRISNTCRYPDGTTFTPSTTQFTADSNTKLLIHSDWTGGLGADSSGNYNSFAVTNLVATDQMIDTPTDNFCTINPLWNPGTTFSDGNLRGDYSTNDAGWIGSVGVSSGKWYWEYRPAGGSDTCVMGVLSSTASQTMATDRSSNAGVYGIQNAGGSYAYRRENGTTAETTGFPKPVADDVVNCALDMENSKLYLGINGVYYSQSGATGDPAAGTNETFSSLVSDIYLPFNEYRGSSQESRANFGQDSSFGGTETSGSEAAQDSNGKGDFYDTPPSGFLALCTDNLSDPEIALPGENFNSILWTGTPPMETGSTSFTGVGFQPDFVWTKIRSAGYGHLLWDSVRGVSKNLASDSNAAEVTDNTSGDITAFGSDGFTYTIGSTNYFNYGLNTETYIAWNWKAGGAAASNTDGTITSSVSANPTAGFSIVSYTGTGSLATVGHGLGVAPELVIIKDRTTASTSWSVGTTAGVDFTYVAYLNATNAFATDAAYFNNTDPSPTVFTINTNNYVNDTDDYIAYCFASIEGYSKVGSYEGNGDADGTFIYTGFSPKFFLSKNIDNTQNWTIQGYYPGYNPEDRKLIPNETGAEGTGSNLDFLSNGVKWRVGYNEGNGSYTYLYMAFAESPFKYSNAR